MSADPRSSEAREIERLIFEMACGLPDEAMRGAFLAKAYGGDTEGLARIEGLVRDAKKSAMFFLDASEQRAGIAGEILEQDFAGARQGQVAEGREAEKPGARIGRYRLIERIGEGGGGVVYEAEQEGEIRRRVALKIIRPGMDSEAVVERFDNERKALALMEHPNIARVFDAGVTETGRPYFVMELVRGKRITAYCDECRLALRERLQLFVEVCHAIQHAHQKGVIHRDIKPSNILVASRDGEPVPKVIDFGIAKATGNRFLDDAMRTGLDQFLGTPVYMSPEQVDFTYGDVDTKSDIYSLGALLYEMVTGVPPFDPIGLVKAGLSAMRRTLLESDPALPSARLAAMPASEIAGVAALRRTEPARLIAWVRRDLDWIVTMAMEKDRSRRYMTVNGLAMDVERFLADRPIVARRMSRRYALGKFIRRNRLMCVSGTAVAVSLVAGLGFSTHMFIRERIARREQQRLRVVAEAAQASETRLRHQALAIANLSNAAALLSLGKVSEADAILRGTPVSSIPPTRQATDMFRSLGEANAIHERWKQAAECFDLLMRSDTHFSADEIWGTGDLLRPGPAMLEAGDRAAYERTRRDMVARFGDARVLNTADQVVKGALLLPADTGLLNKLAPSAALVRQAVEGEPPHDVDPVMKPWYYLALALYELRCGNFERAVVMAETAADDRSKLLPEREASIHAIIAMACKARGDTARFDRELAAAREWLAKPAPAPVGLPGVGTLVWEDRAIARILLREAESRSKR